jgi:sodium/hydrogen antiporter
LSMALTSAYVRRLPISSSSLYLLLGVALGPLGLDWLRISFAKQTSWLEHLTEVAVIISLFVGGLKLRLPFSADGWRAVPRLAVLVMVCCIAGIALFARYALGLDTAGALLLGAVLAPTDPVLASAVSVSEASDEDPVRYGLSGEAGLNDGMAFPFVVLALSWSAHGGGGTWLGSWLLVRVLWAIPVALGVGYLLGRWLGGFAVRMRSRQQEATAPSDFLALALIAISYVLCELLEAWGFLGVFAAGVGLRAAELATVHVSPHPSTRPDAPVEQGAQGSTHPPAEQLVAARECSDSIREPAVAAGVMVAETLSFGDTAERILELLLVTVVGAALSEHWDARGLVVAFVLFVMLRPLSTVLALARTPTSRSQRWLMGWFGIRGIGSLYYLGYALNEQAHGPSFGAVTDITISVVALSIVVHGVSVTPLLGLYERSRVQKRRKPQQPSKQRDGRRGQPGESPT